MLGLVSYAQNQEDMILFTLLHKTERGFYVDVGANHETFHSVTKFFYERGWHGINIEPTKSLIKEYDLRDRDINLNVAVSDKKGELPFREYPHHDGLSTVAEVIKKNHEQNDLPHVDYSVKVTTLESIFKQNNVGKIDFLKIDVEGHELEVLKGNDWNKYRPAVVVFEGTVREACIAFLTEVGYNVIHCDGLNYYLVAAERTDIDMHQYSNLLLSHGYKRHHEAILEEKYEELVKQAKELKDIVNDIPPLRKVMKIFAKSLRRSLKDKAQKLIFGVGDQ